MHESDLVEIIFSHVFMYACKYVSSFMTTHRESDRDVVETKMTLIDFVR